jgi:hypothetical protein
MALARVVRHPQLGRAERRRQIEAGGCSKKWEADGRTPIDLPDQCAQAVETVTAGGAGAGVGGVATAFFRMRFV